MAAAVPLSPDSAIASAATDASASTIYEVRGHRKYWLKETRDGQTAVALSNFEARIVAEVARGDGVEEIRHFVLKGTVRECATLGRKARGMTHKMIAFDFGISINTVGNLVANAFKKFGVHGAAAAVHAHRDAHFYCGTRVDFGLIRERLEASRSTSSCP